jgi:uncharacterized tellurite resistance protein B-like protein
MMRKKWEGYIVFINELNKEQGKAFLSLLKNLAEVDYNLVAEEYKLIEEYCKDLGLEENDVVKLENNEILTNFEAATSRIKNIVYFELLGLALTDGEFDNKEIKFMNNIAAKLSISEETQESCLNYFKEIKTTYDNFTDNVEDIIGKLYSKAEAIINK